MQKLQNKYRNSSKRLAIQYRVRRGVTVVALINPTIVDSRNHRRLAAAVSNRLAPGVPVVLDATRIEFFESEGIDMLLSLDRCAAQRRASFSLCGLNGSVAQVFRISGLDCLFRIFPDTDAALEALAGQGAEPGAWH
jgi:anti-anti-sigma factor